MDKGRGRDITVEPEGLTGHLRVPIAARALVIFAHGSGSGRRSPRNNAVAIALGRAGFATLLVDLLKPEEETDRRNVFDVPLLASRLAAATRWARAQPETRELPVGYFGASTGAGAALVAAAADPNVKAIVSRGGRPDLAEDMLPMVTVPTLLIVGSRDPEVLALNRRAYAAMAAPREIAIVADAGHLFEEPGTMEEVIRLARRWFAMHLVEAGSVPNGLRFRDRRDAGRRLADALTHLKPLEPLVLALPRGGVPVAYEVAMRLAAPLDLAMVRKVGAPGYPELAIGAVVDGSDPQLVLDDESMKLVHPDADYVERTAQRELRELERRRALYRPGRLPPDVTARVVVVVDDGLATGSTMIAAMRALARKHPARLVAAVPVGPDRAVERVEREADEVICLLVPPDFRAVGFHYDRFDDTSDEEVIDLLARADSLHPEKPASAPPGVAGQPPFL